VDGVVFGRAPLTADVESKRPHTVRWALPGHREVEKQQAATDSLSPIEVSATLERVSGKKGNGEIKVVRDDSQKEKPRAVASVQFVAPIGAWARVKCGGRDLGETPFGEVQLPVGTLECEFSNPDLGNRTQRVEVRANEKNVVKVKF
jgi:eukaryotic-like serine/threonine-protein kinase